MNFREAAWPLFFIDAIAGLVFAPKEALASSQWKRDEERALAKELLQTLGYVTSQQYNICNDGNPKCVAADKRDWHIDTKNRQDRQDQ